MTKAMKFHMNGLKAMTNDLKAFQDQYRPLLEQTMDQYLKDLNTRPLLRDAMAYSVDAGGKRIRPLIIMLVCDAFGREIDADVLACGSALEFIHTYSLIHDDLPEMDNDDLRRGKPTNHKVFGPAMAVLAGDGLLTTAFEIMSQTKLTAAVKTQLIADLALASGPQGMVNGQVGDIEGETKKLTLDQLKDVHAQKTGALLVYAFMAGGLLAGKQSAELALLKRIGANFGLAFQIYDDIMDVVSDTATMGKKTQKDQAEHKNTYPGLLGLEGAYQELAKVKKLVSSDLETLAKTTDCKIDLLAALLNYFKVGNKNEKRTN
ncbi:farnesyl-diphosphate synthase [Ligilactobacillus sp. WC1T17]|uniref:Farnesyl-diphosphate synthase n=2 Tax=Ligilactobacillus TaxID=2767887 RepID=A0ABY1A9I3_9LACO|nr:farnesyl-diphosphate synthase [Ligilactobacillus ruminis]